MVEPTSLLLGLEGLGVSPVVRLPDRTRVVEVITVDPSASCCPGLRNGVKLGQGTHRDLTPRYPVRR